MGAKMVVLPESAYKCTDYSSVSYHDDQEGFFVLEGYGWAKVGEEEFRLEPEISFIVPTGVGHRLKSDTGSSPVKVFWFHSVIADEEV